MSIDAALTNRRTHGRGFSLTELIVVILIIGVVVSIIIPALGAARDVARTQSTRTLMTSISSAAETFRLDRRRYPGRFGAELMGGADNGGSGGLPGTLNGFRGLSAAENVMLDLASSDAIFSEDDPSRVSVGPSNDIVGGFGSGEVNETEIFVNPGLIGSGSNSYFAPSAEFYVEQTTFGDSDPFGAGTKQADAPSAGHAAEPGELQLPDLVDAFGTPLLIWTPNSDVVTDVFRSAIVGGRRYLPSDPIGQRLLYWNSNAAFLRANSLGEGEANMNLSPFNPENRPASLIGAGAVGELGDPDVDIGRMMSMFFGSPNYPDEETLRDTGATYYLDLFPRRARGDFIIHSGGPDQIYFSSRDRAVRSYLGGAGYAPSSNIYRPNYGINFGPAGGSGGERWTDDAGKPTSIDFAGEFDDILVTTN